MMHSTLTAATFVRPSPPAPSSFPESSMAPPLAHHPHPYPFFSSCRPTTVVSLGGLGWVSGCSSGLWAAGGVFGGGF
ncbi:unnamed protein product [Rhodiola kirilowii]